MRYYHRTSTYHMEAYQEPRPGLYKDENGVQFRLINVTPVPPHLVLGDPPPAWRFDLQCTGTVRDEPPSGNILPSVVNDAFVEASIRRLNGMQFWSYVTTILVNEDETGLIFLVTDPLSVLVTEFMGVPVRVETNPSQLKPSLPVR